MPVFACLYHIKEELTHSLSYTSKGKHSLYCADFSLSPYFIFPLPLWAQEGCTHTLTPEQAWRSSDHTQSSARLSLAFPLSFSLFYMVTRSLSFPLLLHSPLSLSLSLSTSHLLSAQPDRGRVKVTCPQLHVSISTRCVLTLCLFECADVNCREDGHLVWYLCLWDHPASQAKTLRV